MKIRPYAKADHSACMDAMQSNTPKYFADDEVDLFDRWLEAQELGRLEHPVSEKEVYFVLEVNGKVIGCGGYLLVKESDEIFLAWGMVHNDFHKQGLGLKLLDYRINHIIQHHPERRIALSTTQDIAPFFEKYGFIITQVKPRYYSSTLDRVEMERKVQ